MKELLPLTNIIGHFYTMVSSHVVLLLSLHTFRYTIQNVLVYSITSFEATCASSCNLPPVLFAE